MAKSRASILLVDDDPGFRALVSVLCDRAGYSCRDVANGAEALAAAVDERPDVVLLDVMLGGESGYQVCRQLREQLGDQLPIIFVSGARTEVSDRVAGLLLGADDYVTKPIDPEELLARVQRAVQRSKAWQHALAGVNGSGLTPREREVLTLLAEGLSTEEMSERLYISPKTVSTHVQRILAKLGLHSRAEAVAFAFREALLDDGSSHGLTVS